MPNSHHSLLAVWNLRELLIQVDFPYRDLGVSFCDLLLGVLARYEPVNRSRGVQNRTNDWPNLWIAALLSLCDTNDDAILQMMRSLAVVYDNKIGCGSRIQGD